jgi:hypothetical protein
VFSILVGVFLYIQEGWCIFVTSSIQNKFQLTMEKLKKFSVSPFLVSWMKAGDGDGMGETIDVTNGISDEVVKVPKARRMMDRMAYSKVSMKFCSDVCSSDVLGISGLRMLFVLLRVLNRNKEQVFLNYAIFESMAQGTWKAHTYYKGLNELIKANVLAKVENAHDMYWVNTDYVFKGDRVKMLNDKRFGRGMGN